MRKQLLLIALVWLFANVCQAQKKYEMVIEKTDGTNIVVNTEDILRTYFRERTGGDTPQPAALDIVGTWNVYEGDQEGLDAIWTFKADGTGTIEEFYHGESEGVDKMKYNLSGTRLTVYFEGEEDDPMVFDINVVSENEFTWTDGHDTLTFKRQGSGDENPPSDIADFNIVGKWNQYADDRQEASAEWVFNTDGTGYCTPLPVYPGEGPDPFTYSITNTTLTINWEDATSVYEIHIVSATEYWYENNSDWAKKLTFKKVDGGNDHPQSFLSCPDDHHPHMIDLGLPSGTKWQCCNEGASRPEDFGGYYKFGEVSSAPSFDQIKELVNNCRYSWTTLNGVNGGRFTGKNGGTIFLPAAGYVWRGELHYVGSYGDYWSSTPDGEGNAVYWGFGSGGASWGDDWDSSRGYELSVRPVR